MVKSKIRISVKSQLPFITGRAPLRRPAVYGPDNLNLRINFYDFFLFCWLKFFLNIKILL